MKFDACFAAGVVRALAQGSTDVDPARGAQEFRTSFKETYGECSPNWVESSWQVGRHIRALRAIPWNEDIMSPLLY